MRRWIVEVARCRPCLLSKILPNSNHWDVEDDQCSKTSVTKTVMNLCFSRLGRSIRNSNDNNAPLTRSKHRLPDQNRNLSGSSHRCLYSSGILPRGIRRPRSLRYSAQLNIKTSDREGQPRNRRKNGVVGPLRASLPAAAVVDKVAIVISRDLSPQRVARSGARVRSGKLQGAAGVDVNTLAARYLDIQAVRTVEDGVVGEGVAYGVCDGRIGAVCCRVGGRAKDEASGCVELKGAGVGQEGLDCKGPAEGVLGGGGQKA